MHGRRGRGSRRLFRFSPLPFESDRDAFDTFGGDEATQSLIRAPYPRYSDEEQICQQLVAPSDFTFNGNLDGLIRFVYELRRQAFIDRGFANGDYSESSVYINLDQIRSIDLRGALILAAEFDRIRRIIGFRPTLHDHRWDPQIRATLRALGLHDIIQASSRHSSEDASLLPDFASGRFQIIKMRSGTASSNKLAQELRDELLHACKPFSAARPQIYNVLVEAFNNSREHAYPNGSGEDGIPSVKGWWAGALVDHQKGLFNLAVYDQGIGIPERFSRQHETSREERELVGGAGDMLVLQRAAEHGSSSTYDPGRGNGLWQMTDLTRTIPGSRVEFTSLRGSVTYQGGILQSCFIPPQRFCGTIIDWIVPFKAPAGATP